MTMAKKNPKLNHEQWLLIQKDNIKMIVELQQENEKLRADVEELKAKEVALECENKKLREKDQQLVEEAADGGKKMRKVKEGNNEILIEFMERQILELEEELECPVCLEVASAPPIFKCPDNHLICRFLPRSHFSEMISPTPIVWSLFLLQYLSTKIVAVPPVQGSPRCQP